MSRRRLPIGVFVLVFILALIGHSSVLNALDPGKMVSQYNVKQWSMKQGLPGNAVYAVERDKHGYLWLGTQNGLVRFNGLDFKVFNRGSESKLKDDFIRALYYQERDDTLWIGTDSGGLTRYSYSKKDKAYTFETYPIEESPSLRRIYAINEDRNGTLWIGSFENGLTCFRKGKLTPHSTKYTNVRTIFKDQEENLWASCAEGIVKIGESGVTEEYKVEGDLGPTACLYDTDTGDLWIGTGKKGLLRLKKGETKPEKVKAIDAATIGYLYRDKKGNLWVGTDGEGLIRYNSGDISSFKGVDELEKGYIYTIFEDKEESLWVGTLDDGLFQLRDGKFINYRTTEGMIDNYINCILYSKDGKYLWAGTDEGLSRIDLETGNVDPNLTAKNSIAGETIASLYETHDGNLLIGTDDGLWEYDHKTFTKKQFTGENELSDNQINTILIDNRGTWLGTENGLNLWNSKTKKIRKRSLVDDEKNGNEIALLYQDDQGTIWVGTNKSLLSIKPGETEPKPFSSSVSLPNTEYSCIHKDSNGVFWIGTAGGGLLRHDPEQMEKDHLFTVNDKNGIKDNYVYSILEDDNGYMWLGGQNGIFLYVKQELEDFADMKIEELHPVVYNELDGMEARWVTTQGLKTRDNKLWFPTAKGVAVIDPEAIKSEKIEPPMVKIDRIEIDGIEVQLPVKGEDLLVPARAQSIEVFYSAISLTLPERLRYKYALEKKGESKELLPKGKRPSAQFSTLSPGRYTFKVAARIGFGNWSDSTHYYIYKKSFIYQTLWFYAVVLLLAGLSVYLVHRYRVMLLKAREKELAVLVDQRTSDLRERNTELETARQKIEATKNLIQSKNTQLEDQTLRLKEQAEKLLEMDKIKSRFFANISHEFRTPLTLIMGPLEQMLTDAQGPKEEKKYNLMLRNSQRLLGLINQLLELSRFESGKVKLQACRQDIVPLLKGITVNFETVSDQRELELEFQAQPDEIYLYLDAPKIEDIMDNLLINAVKFTPAGGRITVTVSQMDNKESDFPEGYLQISVSDTGRGIPKEKLPQIFNRFYQSGGSFEGQKKGTGIGLALVKELVQLHHGKIDVYSREGKGTEFIIQLPLGKTHLEPGDIVEIPDACEKRPYPGIPGAVLGEDEENNGTRTAEDRQAETLETEPGKGKEIILVVEDSADVREYIRGILEPEFDVIEAKNGERGLERAFKIIPDLIISDVMMPGLDGCELCSRLKKDIKTSHIPIILLTAKASEESILQGLETGADDYITKPFNATILMARIRNLIELRRQLQASINRKMTLQPSEISMTAMDEAFLEELNKVIDKNLPDPDFNVEQLSKELIMDRSTVYRKTLALTGETPTEFIRSCRLKKGAELLKSKFGSVLEVAFEVGFSSANYFTKCFKQKFHQLPTSYRESQ